MREYRELDKREKTVVLARLAKWGFTRSLYEPEHETGASKEGIGFMLKDLIIEDGSIGGI